MSALMYKLENVVQKYTTNTVLHLDNFCIHSGEILGISGPNGSGKSTLLRILAFLESPVSGEVYFQGEKTSPNNGRQARRQASLLLQDAYLLNRSVQSNIGYGLKIRGIRDTQGRISKALELVDLAPDKFMKRLSHELSGGERQRVALAARLALRPKVLLLDEPTASLDKGSAGKVKDAALMARKQWDTTLVIVSHDLPWLESVCDSQVHIEDGHLKDQA